MAVRRARRSRNPYQQAQLSRTIENRATKELERKLQTAIAKGVQEFAVLSMNSLAQAGPAWSGEFSASWGFVPAGMTPSTPGVTGQIFSYSKGNVPVNDVKRYLSDGLTRFQIVNTSPHAAIAIDEEMSTFRGFGLPLKEATLGAGRKRSGSLRYDIGQAVSDPKESNASRTAEPGWFETYKKGGQLQNDLLKGVEIGFQA